MTTSNEHNNAPAVPQGRPFGHFRAEPFGWTDCAATDDGAIALYEHPMTNPWRDAVIEQLESWHIYVPAIHDNSPRLAIKALVNIETKAALDPAVSSEAAALVAGQHNNAPAVPQGWRDFLTELSKQKPEKPDYWSSCGQCERNSSTAEDLIAATPAPAPAQGEPFGYFRAEPFGWTDCSEDAEGAIALYEHPAKPAQEVSDKHEREMLEVIDERDRIHEWADQLADAIAKHTGYEIGEHTSGNNPWRMALNALVCHQACHEAKPAQEVGLTDRQFDLICQAIDKADTVTMDGDYMLDSDDCIRVVRVMQVLFDIAALRAKGQT